jgi:hypothetical protein
MSEASPQSQLLSEHLGLLLAGVPVVVVGAKILIAARGNSSALAQIIQDIDASQVLLATVTSAILPVLQTLMAMFGSTRIVRIAFGAPVSSNLNFTTLVLVISVLLTAIVQPWNSAVIALVFVSLVVVGRRAPAVRAASNSTPTDGVAADDAEGDDEEGTDSSASVPAGVAFIQSPLFMLALLGLLILSQPTWLPSEDITLRGASARTASVLRDDGSTLSVLWSNSTVERIEASAITSRVICRRTPPSFFSLVSDDESDKAPPKCAD